MPYTGTPRAILLAGPCLAGVMGLAYLFGDASRTESTSFDAAKSVAPMHTWGVVFLIGSVLLTIALLTRNATLLAAAWFLGGVMYVWWGSCFGLQALTDPTASLVGWALYAVVAVIHFVVGIRCWRNRVRT